MAKGSRPGGRERPGARADGGLPSEAEVLRSCAELRGVEYAVFAGFAFVAVDPCDRLLRAARHQSRRELASASKGAEAECVACRRWLLSAGLTLAGARSLWADS
jgi:hypothetical protein